MSPKLVFKIIVNIVNLHFFGTNTWFEQDFLTFNRFRLEWYRLFSIVRPRAKSHAKTTLLVKTKQFIIKHCIKCSNFKINLLMQLISARIIICFILLTEKFPLHFLVSFTARNECIITSEEQGKAWKNAISYARKLFYYTINSLLRHVVFAHIV